jgi:hypothetical protein
MVSCAAPLLVLFGGVVPAQAAGESAEVLQTEQRFNTYVYAHEFGSGIYDFSGRTLQVYRLPFSRQLRAPSADKTGIRLTLPVTLGFIDFQPGDVLHTGLPEGIDSISFVPGIEWEWLKGEHWRLYPYVKAGASFTNGSTVDANLFGAGVRTAYRWDGVTWHGLFREDLIYSAANYRGELPADDFVRWRQGVDMSRATAFKRRGHQLQFAMFGVLDIYPDAPRGVVTGTRAAAVQVEVGFTAEFLPQPRWWRLPMPKLGVSYRWAGEVSSWRFVIGAPF